MMLKHWNEMGLNAQKKAKNECREGFWGEKIKFQRTVLERTFQKYSIVFAKNGKKRAEMTNSVYQRYKTVRFKEKIKKLTLW